MIARRTLLHGLSAGAGALAWSGCASTARGTGAGGAGAGAGGAGAASAGGAGTGGAAGAGTGGAAGAGTGHATASPPASDLPRVPIRGICFDLFTLFDPRSVIAVAEAALPGHGAALCEAWRTRQFEYAWLRVAGDRYVDFQVVTEEALVHALRARKLELDAAARDRLVAAYWSLTPWPDAQPQLEAWKRAGLRLAPLANYAPGMLSRLIASAGWGGLFDDLLSTDLVRTFKPDPRAYALGVERLGLPRETIVFSAFGGWDAVGAKWFGYPSFWVNRLGVAAEELGASPDGTGHDLGELARFIDAWASRGARSTP